jgi:hypothetical protein
MNDPVVKDLNSWINRSSGQHKRRISEGTESARRLAKLPEQTEEQAANLKAWRDSLVLHRVDTSQLGERDGVSVGGCCTHECNEGRDCPEREFDGDAPLMTMLDLFAIVFIIGGFVLLAYSYIR